MLFRDREAVEPSLSAATSTLSFVSSDVSGAYSDIPVARCNTYSAEPVGLPPSKQKHAEGACEAQRQRQRRRVRPAKYRGVQTVPL